VKQGLLLGGGISTPRGEYHSSMQLLESGFFDDAGFTHLHVAGHPEGNRDIDPDGGEAEVMAALKWKQDFANRSDASFAIATQFAFEAGGVVAWAERLAAAGIEMPVHLGVAGPAKLQTLIKFAIACGVGKSLGVLQKRAKDVTKLLMPFEPTEFWPIWPRARPRARRRISSASISSRSAGSRPMPNGRWPMAAPRRSPPRRPPSPDTTTTHRIIKDGRAS
jgi:5,10-methylenetetrahydrofolate reductase